MKVQFRTADILIATSFIAITMGGVSGVMQQFQPASYQETILGFLLIESPFWLPIAFAAYALGRRRVTLGMLIAFVIADAIGLGVVTVLRQLRYF